MLLHARFRRHAWVAVLAILVLALAPTVSRALAARQALHDAAGAPPAWAQICLHGAVVMATQVADPLGAGPGGPGPEAPPAQAAASLDHCGLCALGADLAAPPMPVTLAGAGPLAATVPPLFLRAPRPLFAWSAAQPRAPPFLLG